MKSKQIIPVLLVLLAGGGIYLWSHRNSSGGDDSPDESTPTVVSVQVGKLRRGTLRGYVTGYGKILPAPASANVPAATARVAAPMAGVARRVLVSEGMQVAQGTLLVELEDQAAAVAVRNAREAADRQKKLYAENNTSLKNLQDAEAQLASAQAQLSLLRITAPLAGTITRLNVRPGEAVDPATAVAEITDLSRLVVSVDIPSAESSRVEIGDPIEISGADGMASKVDYVSPAVDASNDTVNMLASLPADHAGRVGTTVPVRIVTEEHAACLAVPAESVVTNPDGQAVIAIVHGDEAVQVPVKTGLRDGPLVEVSADGINAGDDVVTVGAYGLPARTKIKVVKATRDTTD